METLQVFKEPGIGASVLIVGREEYLEIDEHGLLATPAGLKPPGFHLVLVVPQEARIVFAQRNVRQDKGAYHRHTLAQLARPAEGLATWVMHDPIPVIRDGKNVYTPWHSEKPNRVDCWLLGEEGRVELFQVGTITHDNGQTFRLLGEYRWRGRLFQDGERVVGKPDHPKWGRFDVRGPVLDDLDFKKLLEGATLQSWTGRPEELDPPLERVPGPGLARVDWYTPFGGQTGQGIAKLPDGSPAWVHGADILDPPDPDGIKRLERNDLVRYEGLPLKWGSKSGGPPKLLKVQRVLV